jgi:hypothetical protein
VTDNLDFFGESAEVVRMRDIMIDIETMGTRPDSAILALGACTFDARSLVIGERFYLTISLQSCIDAGLKVDGSTVMWWMGQSDDARRDVRTGTQEPLASALCKFSAWIEASSIERKSRQVWGNGASFDPVIVESAYRACSIEVPWEFWGVRCFRTLKNLWPNVEPPQRKGVHHNALDDAEFQVEHFFAIRRHLRGQA